MKIFVPLWYLAEYFLESGKFQKNVVEKIKTQILYSVNFFQKNFAIVRYFGKIC
jgi:hypothetical protein